MPTRGGEGGGLLKLGAATGAVSSATVVDVNDVIKTPSYHAQNGDTDKTITIIATTTDHDDGRHGNDCCDDDAAAVGGGVGKSRVSDSRLSMLSVG